MPRSNRDLTVTALLAVFILVSGTFKLPSPLPGGDFQLSAPIAVLICALFGFRRYFLAGIIASLLGMLLGTANLFNVIVALVFRLVAGLVLELGGVRALTLALAGPAGTFTARLVLACVTGISWQVLALAALPGMIFTAITSALLYRPAKRLLEKVSQRRS